MIPILLTTASFGILPIIYKGLLMKGINKITILIITKILIAFMGIILLLLGSNSDIVTKDIKKVIKDGSYIIVITLTFLAAIVYFTGQYNYIESIDNYQANISTVIISSYPVVTLILAYLYFNETITYLQFIGILLILTGLILISY